MKRGKTIRFTAWALCVLAASFSVSCSKGGGKESTGESQSSSEPPETVEVSTENAEKDYVYLSYGQGDKSQKFDFQTPDYMLSVTAAEGRISGLQPLSYGEKHFVQQDFDSVASADTRFYVQTAKGLSSATGVQTVDNSSGESSGRYWRLLEGGRYKQKTDVPKLVYDKESSLYGRMEIVAYQMNFRLEYDLFSPQRLTDAIPFFDFVSEEYDRYSVEEGGRAVLLKNENSDGVAFLLPSDGSVRAEKTEDNGVRFTSAAMTVPAKTFTGFAVNAVPFTAGDLSVVREVLARDAVGYTVARLAPEADGNVSTLYEESTGTLLIDGNVSSGKAWHSYNDQADFNAYDVFSVTLKNEGAEAVRYPVSVLMNNSLLNSTENVFRTSSPCSLVGLSSFIRDAAGYPIGKPVQVSKNWHSYASNEVEAVARTYTGQWYVGTVYLDVPAGGEVTYEFVTAYAKWGETEAASHSQLSLIGWDMYDLWEQLAVGDYGENICYYVNGNGSSSWIQDIRPFSVKSYHGNYVKYSWSGNVGGGEFLRYSDAYERVRYVNEVHSDFRSQGPNMTETDTFGYTSDGKIYTQITANLLRTDDVTRIYYTVDYTFLENVDFTRMTLFQYATERYQQDYYRKYAYGNADGVIFDGDQQVGYTDSFCTDIVPQQMDVAGEDPWFFLYDFDFSKREETSGAAFIVREYNAEINGKTYRSPTVNFRNSSGQLTYELTTPAEIGKTVAKGSKISMVIELTVLPGNAEYFYGRSDYMNATIDLFNTAQQALQQAQGGRVEANASVGRVTANYPVTISCDGNAGETVAEFSLKGGLGYVPVKLCGLDSYNGYKLQVRKDGVWTDVDQSVKGNDFWQCGFDNASGKYYLIYNVKNTSGTAFGAQNDYRLIAR